MFMLTGTWHILQALILNALKSYRPTPHYRGEHKQKSSFIKRLIISRA